MEPRFNDGCRSQAALWISEYVWSYKELVPEHSPYSDITSLHGSDYGDLRSAQCSEI